ncbi:MAG: hypothetical protein ACK4PH_17385 [Aquincola tertiaricarbonis]
MRHSIHPRQTLPLQRGEGRWLPAGRGLQVLVQHGSVCCQGTPQWPATGGAVQRLADGEAGVLRGWTWLQAERSSLLLLMHPPGHAALWHEAARSLQQALRSLGRAAVASLRQAPDAGLR